MNAKLAFPDLEAMKGSNLTFAVALGGGGARGISHIQVIEALDELGITPVAISGSSIGAIMGAGRASGMSGGDLRQFMMEMASNRGRLLNKLWSLGPATMRDKLGGFRFGHFNLELILDALLPQQVPDDFFRAGNPAEGLGDGLLRPGRSHPGAGRAAQRACRLPPPFLASSCPCASTAG